MQNQKKKKKQKKSAEHGKKRVVIVTALLCSVLGLTIGSSIISPAVNAKEADDRETFTVLEIVPHEVCSIFPYLVEWGSKEAYDANVPVGYDELLKYTEEGSGIGIATDDKTKADSALPYTRITQAEKRDAMLSYDVEIREEGSHPEGNWYKVNTKEERQENGYFEYVGDGKGLYNLNVKGSSNFNSTAKAVSKGSGKYDVSDFAFYAKHGTEEGLIGQRLPGKGKPKIIEAYTANNYNLKFTYQGVAGGNYAIDSILNNERGDYRAGAVVYRGTSTTEKRYAISKAAESENGRYIRISDASRNDGFFADSTKAGYFELYDKNETYDSTALRYSLHFKTDVNGVYEITDFEYTADDKGDFDVWFRHTDAGTGRYAVQILSVSDEGGDYAAMTTSSAGDRKPNYTRKSGGNYDLFIESADSVSGEVAGADKCWIWVGVTDEDEMRYSRLDEFQAADGSVIRPSEMGTRLYAWKQKRTYSYYARNGFQNNEWLKLRCIFADKDNPDQPYALNGKDTALQNLADAKADLSAYDANNRIEVITKKAEEVTVADVNSADLIYISDQVGLHGLKDYWEKHGGLSYPKYADSSAVSDFSFEVAQNIWFRCVYLNEASLMVNVTVGDTWVTRRNTAKLLFMMNFFEDPTMFAKFLYTYPNDGRYNYLMTAVLSDGTARHSEGADARFYNRQDLRILAGKGEEDDDIWRDEYFMVWEESDNEWNPRPHKEDDAYANHKYNWQQRDKDVPRDSYMMTNNNDNAWFGKTSNMEKIWQILHNRNINDLKLTVTNASLMNNGEMVLCEDELAETFNIDYQATSTKGGNAKVDIFFDDMYGNEAIVTGLSVPLNTEQSVDVRGGFLKDGILNPAVKKRRVVLTADSGGKTVKAEVWVVVRDLFTLD